MKVIKVSKNISYIPYLTNIGVIAFPEKSGKTKIYLIDCGSNETDGKIILESLSEEFHDFYIEAVIITHAHYDHCGGLTYLADAADCGGWICEDEEFFMHKPLTITEMTWGGAATHELKSTYSIPRKVSRTFKNDDKFVISGDGDDSVIVEVMDLSGHSSAQTGFRLTDSDGKKIFFAGDALSGRNALSKYWIQFLLDEKRTKTSLEKLMTVKADFFIPGHGNPVFEIEGLAELNLLAIIETENFILKLLETPKSFDDLLKDILDDRGIKMSVIRFALMGATLRSYLSAFYEDGKIEALSIENRLCWKTKSE